VRRAVFVGNAPLGASDARADGIDEADLVVRANSLALDSAGEQRALGRRCHAVLLSRSTRVNRWVFQNYRSRAYLVMQAGFTTFRTLRENPTHWPADLGAQPVPNAIVTRPLADLLQPGHEPGSVIPTTGTTGVFMLHELFPEAELRVTGLSFLDDPDQTQWEHHSGGGTTVNEKHDLRREAALLRSWLADGSLTVLD
jgi:hypothetical protein